MAGAKPSKPLTDEELLEDEGLLETPFGSFSDSVDEDLRVLFRQLVWEVPYEAVSDRMSPSEFARLVKLVVADEWWDIADEVMARHLKTEVKYLATWRKSPNYAVLRHHTRIGMEEIKKTDTAEALLKSSRFQTRVLRETAQLMTSPKTGPMIKQKAGEALLDRMAPRLTKDKEVASQQQFFIMDSDMAGRLIEVFEQNKRVVKTIGESSEVHKGPLAVPSGTGE